MTSVMLLRSGRPLVSIVMVTHGGWDWPERSLAAVAEATPPLYEVVVVDNASWDGTPDLLEELVDGLGLIRNDRNVGFAAAANQGAAGAGGEFLCFLNPDCLVGPGWLRPLVEALEHDPRAGAAIPRFLDPEGRVQEAGSAVDRQGWTHAFGAGADPGDPEHRFRRYVDYASAACLVIRRRAFEEAGGFHPDYFMYCEDVDLCLTLRDRGLRTVFEPRSTVVHAGAASTSAPTRARLIEQARGRLMERWGHRLVDRPALLELDFHPHRLVALRDAEAPDRLLVLADRVPPAGELREALGRAAARPDARITLLVGQPGGEEPLLAEGVEVVAPTDPGAWLEGRRFHYGAVAGDGLSGFEGIDRILGDTQPQALRVGHQALTEQGLEELFLSLGAAPLD
ncbi:MAG: glycosyltransferase family 2 protein [Actinomycetota bacterium]